MNKVEIKVSPIVTDKSAGLFFDGFEHFREDLWLYRKKDNKAKYSYTGFRSARCTPDSVSVFTTTANEVFLKDNIVVTVAAMSEFISNYSINYSPVVGWSGSLGIVLEFEFLTTGYIGYTSSNGSLVSTGIKWKPKEWYFFKFIIHEWPSDADLYLYDRRGKLLWFKKGLGTYNKRLPSFFRVNIWNGGIQNTCMDCVCVSPISSSIYTKTSDEHRISQNIYTCGKGREVGVNNVVGGVM